jgi:hypothetical protein
MNESCNCTVEENTRRLTPNPYDVLRNCFVKHTRISCGEQILIRLLVLSKKNNVFKYYQCCNCYFLRLESFFLTFICLRRSYIPYDLGHRTSK